MLWLVMVIVIVCIISAIIYDRHQTSKQLDAAIQVDLTLIREAANASLYASNTENQIIALEEAVRAHRTMEVLFRRYGKRTVAELTDMDTEELYLVLERQRDSIRQQIAEGHPELLPKGPLASYNGYVKDREQSHNI